MPKRALDGRATLESPAGAWDTSRDSSREGRASIVLAKKILANIDRGGLRPGTALPSEALLAEDYKVGKGLLREGLRILEVHGFIRVKPGARGGSFVADGGPAAFGQMATMYFQSSHVTLAELLEARVTLEPFAARLAARRNDPDAAAPLVEVIERTKGFDLAGDAAYKTFADGFHGLIGGLSGSRVLDLYVNALREVWLAWVPAAVNTVDRRKKALDDHIKIANAILSGNANRAETLMHEHMTEFESYARERHAALMDQVVEWR
jgi:GntR family transcriptional repressor for pyruvate dehydrogenase complex